jgi:hypothetical protein
MNVFRFLKMYVKLTNVKLLLLAGQMARRGGGQKVEGGDPAGQRAPALKAAVGRPLDSF